MQNSKFLILILLLVLSSCENVTSKKAPFRIVFADSHFCYYKNHKNIKLVNHDGSVACENFDPKLFNKFHGHYVLDTFLKNLKTDREVEIHLFSVFENDQSSDIAWKSVINFVNAEKPDLFISAAALINKTLPLFFNDHTMVFLAAGQMGRFVKKSDRLYPQGLPHTKKLLFGHFFKGKSGNFLDNTLLPYSEAIYMHETDDRQKIKGSSLSLAEGGAKLLSKCIDAKNSMYYQCVRGLLKPFKANNTKLKNLLSL